MTHHLLVTFIPSPWGVPNLTLVGLLLAVTKSPTRWFEMSLVAGVVTMGWAIRFPAAVLLSDVIVGWVMQMLTREFDLSDVWMQVLTVTTASFLMVLLWFWLDHLWSLALFVGMCLHVLLTGATVPVIRHYLIGDARSLAASFPRFYAWPNETIRPPR